MLLAIAVLGRISDISSQTCSVYIAAVSDEKERMLLR